MFNKGYIEIYSGAQPVSADAAETGTLLGVVSVNGAALTKETRATGSVTLTGGASGSINTVTVGGLNIIPDGAVAFNTSLNQTASDLADAINRNGIMEATAAAAVVTLRGRPGTGVTTAAVTATLTTVTATYVNMGSGVAGIAPVNALNLATPSLGIITKPTNQVWNFQGVAAGTAGWFRFYSSDTADTGLLLTGAPWYPRLDGSIATSGADLNLSQIVIAVASSNTIDTFSLTVPAQ
jgi:hypothetical protein